MLRVIFPSYKNGGLLFYSLLSQGVIPVDTCYMGLYGSLVSGTERGILVQYYDSALNQGAIQWY